MWFYITLSARSRTEFEKREEVLALNAENALAKRFAAIWFVLAKVV